MTEPITAMGQLLDERDKLRGLLIEARAPLATLTGICVSKKWCDDVLVLLARIDAALDRDITTALTAPDIQPQG